MSVQTVSGQIGVLYFIVFYTIITVSDLQKFSQYTYSWENQSDAFFLTHIHYGLMGLKIYIMGLKIYINYIMPDYWNT